MIEEFSILIGLLKGFGGSVRVLGKEIRATGGSLYEKIGVSFELPNVYSRLTALENLTLFSALYRAPVPDLMNLLALDDLQEDARTLFDFLLEFRNGFHAAYLVVGAMYVVLLRVLPVAYRADTSVLLVFTDTSVLGFFFVGAILLLERGERTLDALFITPLRPVMYLFMKTASLTLTACAVSLLIILAGYGVRFNPVPLLAGDMLSSVFFRAPIQHPISKRLAAL